MCASSFLSRLFAPFCSADAFAALSALARADGSAETMAEAAMKAVVACYKGLGGNTKWLVSVFTFLGNLCVTPARGAWRVARGAWRGDCRACHASPACLLCLSVVAIFAALPRSLARSDLADCLLSADACSRARC